MVICFFFSRNSLELQAADILMITSIVQNIFPYQSQAVPCSSTRAPTPLFNRVVSKGDSTLYQSLLDEDPNDDNEPGSGYHPPASLPIAINNTADRDTVSMNSSVEEKFYSPPSTPTSDDMAQQASINDSTLNDAFFSPKNDSLNITPQVTQSALF